MLAFKDDSVLIGEKPIGRLFNGRLIVPMSRRNSLTKLNEVAAFDDLVRSDKYQIVYVENEAAFFDPTKWIEKITKGDLRAIDVLGLDLSPEEISVAQTISSIGKKVREVLLKFSDDYIFPEGLDKLSDPTKSAVLVWLNGGKYTGSPNVDNFLRINGNYVQAICGEKLAVSTFVKLFPEWEKVHRFSYRYHDITRGEINTNYGCVRVPNSEIVRIRTLLRQQEMKDSVETPQEVGI